MAKDIAAITNIAAVNLVYHEETTLFILNMQY